MKKLKNLNYKGYIMFKHELYAGINNNNSTYYSKNDIRLKVYIDRNMITLLYELNIKPLHNVLNTKFTIREYYILLSKLGEMF